MGNAEACSSVAQCDSIVIHHAPRLRDDAAGMTEGVAAALKAGESAGLDYSWHNEERGERDIEIWRKTSYVASVQSKKTFNLLYKKTFKMVSCRSSGHFVVLISRSMVDWDCSGRVLS